MKINLAISILLLFIGGYLFETTEYQTVGALIVLGAFFWTVFILLIRPFVNLLHRLFKKTKGTPISNASVNSGPDTNKDIQTEQPNAASKQARTHTGEGKMDYLTPQHKLLLISINRSLKEGADIYNAVRYAWKLNVERARSVDYILAHQGGKVIGVFVADEWLAADNPAFSVLGANAAPDRWGFEGRVAPSEILLLYFGKHLPDDLRKKGASNPIRFLDNSNMDGMPSTNDSNIDERLENGTQPKSGEKNYGMLTGVVGRVDSDGDFSANATLETDQFGTPGEQLFIKSQISVSRDGLRLMENNESDDEILAGDELSISTGFEKIPLDDDARFSFHANVDVYVLDETKTITLDQSAKNVTINFEDLKVRIDAIAVDDDGDRSVKYTVLTDKPSVLAVKIGSEKDSELDGFFKHIDENEEFEDYVMNLSERDNVKVEVVKMRLSKPHIPFQGEGTVNVIAPKDDETDDTTDTASDSEEPTVFYIRVDANDILHDDDNSTAEKAIALSSRARELIDAIQENVDIHARFFSKSSDASMDEIDTNNQSWNSFSESEIEHMFDIESVEYFTIVKGNAHWHKNFLRASEDLSTTLLVCGWNENADAIAVQGYCDGDFDTGIICDPDELDLYSGGAVFERFSISERDFQLDSFGAAD